MPINIPGLSLSILRQQSTVQAGLPLLISGRFTVFGMGVPTFIRIFLEGPSYDPQIRSFDTFASPFSGDYTTNVIAEKDGRYNVYAQAFPPPLIPTGPPFPEAMLLLPPIAESTKPPLVVGAPFNGGVEALLPDGTRERLTAPELLAIEITPIITIGAPAITIPGFPRFIPFPAPPAPPPAPRAPAPADLLPPPVAPPPEPPLPPPPLPPPPLPPPPPPIEEPALVAPVPEVLTLDILGTPSHNLARQLNVGENWFGRVTMPTFAALPLFTAARLFLRDPQGFDYIVSQVDGTLQPGETLQIPVNFDTTGFPGGDYTILLQVFDQFGQQVAEFPMGLLSMIEVIVPPLPPVPAVPEIPTTPTPDMFGTPIVNLPTELEIGEIWQGNISIPTLVPPDLLQLPSLPAFPVNIDLQLQDPAGQLFAVAPISTGTQKTFTPGQTIDLPVNFRTSVLTQEGMHNLIMDITDIQGNPLFSRVIGSLRALMPALLPPTLPLPSVPSEFTSIAVTMGTQQVEVGQAVSVPFTYIHVGEAEVVVLYAAIGDDRPVLLGGFDEVWAASKTVSVPAHATPTAISDSITIPITSKIGAAGIYSVYAKVVPKVISPVMSNIVEVVVPAPPPPPPPPPPPEPTLPRADISDYDFLVTSTGPYEIGETVTWLATGLYKGRRQGGRITISLGTGVLPSFLTKHTFPVIQLAAGTFPEAFDWRDILVSGRFELPATLEPGQRYSIRARLETTEEPTRETDTDFGVITITEAPPPPLKTGFVISLMSGNFPTATTWNADFNQRYYAWFLPVTTPWQGNWDMGPDGESGTLTVELYDSDMKLIERISRTGKLLNGHAYEYYPDTNRLVDVGIF